jgi:hypothetical protein
VPKLKNYYLLYLKWESQSMPINIHSFQHLQVDISINILGGITGAIEISITFPTEYVKTVMQLYPEMNKKGTVNVIKETFASKGPLGKFKYNH